MLRLYLLTVDLPTEGGDPRGISPWDATSGMLVAAASPAQARRFARERVGKSDGAARLWHTEDFGMIATRCVGIARRGITPGTLLVDFNAG